MLPDQEFLPMPRQFLHPQLLQCDTAGPHPSVDAPTTTHQWIKHGGMSFMLSWIISIGFSSWILFRDRSLGKKGAGMASKPHLLLSLYNLNRSGKYREQSHIQMISILLLECLSLCHLSHRNMCSDCDILNYSLGRKMFRKL